MVEQTNSEGGLSPADLWSLHKVAVEEYRFTVNLGWDRQKFFVGISLAITSGAATIIKLGDTAYVPLVASAILGCGFLAALLGLHVLHQGHRYYLNAREALKAVEQRLRLPDDLCLRTTFGMRRPTAEGPAPEPEWARVKIRYAVEGMLVVLAGSDLVGALWILLWQ